MEPEVTEMPKANEARPKMHRAVAYCCHDSVDFVDVAQMDSGDYALTMNVDSEGESAIILNRPSLAAFILNLGQLYMETA